MPVRFVMMRDGADHCVDTCAHPITSLPNPSLGLVSECTPLSATPAERHDTTSHSSGKRP